MRWTQIDAVRALLDGQVVNMAAGEGKSIVYHAFAGRKAVQGDVDALQVLTTRANLAKREFDILEKLFKPNGFDIVQMNPDGTLPPLVAGRPTVYVGTQEDVAFSNLRGKPVPGRHVVIDEIDEALVYANAVYIISDGVSGPASTEVAAQVRGARDFVTAHLADHSLTEEDFGREKGQRGGAAALTDAGRDKVERLLAQQGQRLTDERLKRLNMEAAARWEYLEDTHYLVFDGKVLIIDQTTHAVMTNLDASTEKQSGETQTGESRWNGGLAQALEAKHEEEHAKQGMIIRADSDPNGHHSLSAKQLYERWVNYDTVVGASGTANGKGEQFAQQGLSDTIHDVERYYESRLHEHDDKVFATNKAKLDALAADIIEMQNAKPGQPLGQPQLILVHDNALVRQLSHRLEGVDHKAVDAKWFMEQKKLGKDPREVFKGIIDRAGEPGKVLVVNFQGARGEDPTPTEEAEKLGGLHVRITARSNISHDIDIQAENRAARSGQAGSVQYYLSPQDDLIRLSPNPNVQLAVIRYNTAVDADTTHTTPETTAAVHQAENRLRYLIRQLQTHQAEHAGTLTPTTEQPNAPPTDPTTDPTTDTTTTTTPPQPPHPPPTPPQPTPPPPTPHTTPRP